MVDQVELLLLNKAGVAGYRRVSDAPADGVMQRFGVPSDGSGADASVVSGLLSLALAPDLSRFRRFYDVRTTPRGGASVYRQTAAQLSVAGLYDRVLGPEGWWVAAELFNHADPGVAAVLADMREAASCADAAYALGAVLLACAYRRWLLQGGG